MLSRIKAAFGRGGDRRGVETPAGERLDNVVARQRGLRGASAQERLSRQQTDPQAEEATAPLYQPSAYSSPRSASDPEWEA